MKILECLKALNKSQILAIFIIVFFIVITFLYILPSMIAWSETNNDLDKERNFHMGFFYYFSGQGATPEGSIPDVQMDLTVHYNRGTLVVDDPVTISGLAVINASIPQNIFSMTIHFQNALSSPLTRNSDNITQGTDLLLIPTQNSSIYVGTATMQWALEGSYSPYMIITFSNSSGRFVTQTYVSPDVSITVYPKYQYAQIVTNNVNMILAISVYFLTLVGTGSLVLSLWDRKQKVQNSDNNSNNGNSQPNISNSNPNKRVGRKANSKNAKHHNK